MLDRIDRFVSLISRLGLIFGSLMLGAMMVLTVVDVFMRYVFAAPLPSVAEMTQIMLTMTIFVGFILVTRDGSHIVVSLFEPALTRIAPRLYRLLYAISNTLGTAFILYVLIFAMRDAAMFRTETEVLEVPLTWILGVLIFCCSVALLASATVFTKGSIGHGSAD